MIPVGMGAAAVLQAGLNRQIGGAWGLPIATLMNSMILTLAAIGTYLFVRFSGWGVPELFRIRDGFPRISWWYFVPGILGFTLISGMPYSIARIGALKTFVFFIGAQLVMSIVWDLWVEKIPISWSRVTGIVLVFLGSLLVVIRRNE